MLNSIYLIVNLGKTSREPNLYDYVSSSFFLGIIIYIAYFHILLYSTVYFGNVSSELILRAIQNKKYQRNRKVILIYSTVNH